MRSHGRFADGTIPVIPGAHAQPVRSDRRPLQLDDPVQRLGHCSSWSTPPNGWPDQRRSPRPCPRTANCWSQTSTVAGPALAWGRSGNVWWAIQGRRTRAGFAGDTGSRRAQGAYCGRLGGPTRVCGPSDRASTDRLGSYRPALAGGRSLELDTRRGHRSSRRDHGPLDPRRADLSHRALGRAGQRGDQLVVMRTEPLRRGERLYRGRLGDSRPPTAREANARTSAFACIVSASGRACAQKAALVAPRPGARVPVIARALLRTEPDRNNP